MQNQLRKRNGRFGRNSQAKLLFIPIVLWIAYGAYSFTTGQIDGNPMAYVADKVVHTAIAKREDRLDVAIAGLKKEVIAKLLAKESGGIVVEDGEMFATFDPSSGIAGACRKIGGKMNISCLSFGNFQMKVPTIQLWQKQLGDKVMTDMEAIALAQDTKRASIFVERVIFGIPSSIWAWSGATAERSWFDSKISTIRELEKIQ